MAVPVFAAQKLIDLKDNIVQAFSDESTQVAEEPVTDEQAEIPEEPITDEQPEEPTQGETLDYFGYLKKHITKGYDKVKEGAYGTILIPVTPFIGMFPVYGWMIVFVAFASPFIGALGIGEMLFSPILAAIENYFAG